jgi:hypothetical protein
LHVVERAEHGFVLGRETRERGGRLVAGVLALGVEGSAEVAEEHVFFRVWGDWGSWEVGGGLGGDGEYQGGVEEVWGWGRFLFGGWLLLLLR